MVDILYSIVHATQVDPSPDIRQKEDFQTSVFSFSFSFEMGLFVLVVIDYDERAMLTGNWLVYLVFRWWVHYDGYLHKYLWM